MFRLRVIGLAPRFKFLIIVALTLLPMASILMLVTMTAYLPVFNEMDEIIEISIEEMMPIRDLEKAVLRAAMPPNDYMIFSRESEKSDFLKLSNEIEALFRKIHSSEYVYGLKEGKVAWDKTREHALALFSKTYQVSNVEVYEAMKEFDADVDMTLNKIKPLITNINNSLIKKQSNLSIVKEKGLYTSVFAFISALIVGVSASIFLSKDREKLKEFSEKDALTGLYNRRSFDIRLKRETHAAITLKKSIFSLLIIDADHFKKVNDVCGHQAGDQVLREVAIILRKHVRSSDFVGRYGGEEFAIVLIGATKDQSYYLADRIRLAIENSSISIGEGKSINITASIGIASFPSDADNGKDLIKSADQALYKAKEAGRNRVLHFNH